MITEIQRPTVRLVYTNEFGDVTDITKTLCDVGFGKLYSALRECCLAIGFGAETVEEWLPAT
jgi:hypothetical protein